MKQVLVLALLGGALAGCSGVGSVHPIYTQDNTVSLSGVLGTWTEKDANGVVVISSGAHGGFILRFREDDGILKTFDLHLTKIGGALFADVYSGQGGAVGEDLIRMPVHLFAKIEVKKDRLALYFPDPEWFDRHLSERPSAIHHIKEYPKGEKGWIYLTEKTRKVRAFLKKCVKRPEAFVETMVLTKVSDSQAPPPENAVVEEGQGEGQAPGK
jgi:hypothetical protein